MINPKNFTKRIRIRIRHINFYTGVPDSLDDRFLQLRLKEKTITVQLNCQVQATAIRNWVSATILATEEIPLIYVPKLWNR